MIKATSQPKYLNLILHFGEYMSTRHSTGERAFTRRNILLMAGGSAGLAMLPRDALARTQHSLSGVAPEVSSPVVPPPVSVPDGPTIFVRPGESIQSAIDRLPQAGGRVRILEGTHLITSPIYVRSNMLLEGEGRGRTVVKVPEAYVENFVGLHPQYVGEGLIDLVQGGVVDLILRGFTLDGQIPLDTRNRDGSDGRGGETLHRPWGILLEDRSFSGSDTFSDNNARIEIDDVEVFRTEMGLHVKGCTGLQVHDSKFHHNGGVLLYYHNAYLRRNRQVLVRHNDMTDCHTANGINLTDLQDATFLDNRFLRNYLRGFRIAASQRVEVRSNFSTESQTDWGLLLTSEGSGVDDFSVTDNIVIDNFRGLSVASGTNGVVTDNTVFHNTGGDDIAYNPANNVTVTTPDPTWQYLSEIVGRLRRFSLIATDGIAEALRQDALKHDRAQFERSVQNLSSPTLDPNAADLLLAILARIP